NNSGLSSPGTPSSYCSGGPGWLRLDAATFHQLCIPRVVQVLHFGSGHESIPDFVQPLVDASTVKAKECLQLRENTKKNGRCPSYMHEDNFQGDFFHLGSLLLWHITL